MYRQISKEELLSRAKKPSEDALRLHPFYKGKMFGDDDILPRMDEWDAFPLVAVAAGLKAQEQGVARLAKSREALHDEAQRMMRQAREAVQVLMREGLIAAPPGQ